ncbi:hypothetical protein Tco_0181011 [Tanacetum coccineum]
MVNLKFTDTHNMVAFLSKPAESDGFEQIVDFLNAQPIRYALTVNPTIYISCIKQFWSTGVVKTINREVQLHALVDGKKIIISEASVRRDLKLEDEEGMVRNLDNVSSKILMYPRFVQVFLEQQLDDMSTHKRIYITPSHTKKIFRNMRRVGKGFSGRVTPLFPTMVVQNQQELGEGLAIPTDLHYTPAIIQPSTQPQKIQKPRKPKRKDTQVPQPSGPTDIVADEAVHKELGDSLVRAATTASSLEAEQDSGNITKTRSKATPNESSSLGTTSGGGPRCQETMGDTIAQTRFENVSKHSNDSLLARGNTLRSDEDSLKLKELMELCTNLQQRVLDLENTKTTQANEIARIDDDDEITLVSVQDDVDAKMFDVGTLTGDEVFAEQEVAAKDVNLTVDEVTLAQALAALKSVKPKVKGDVIEEPSVPVSAASASIKDKGKGKMVEPEPVKPTKKKVQIMLDEEIVLKLQAKIDEEERIARAEEEKIDEANIAWDDIQAKVDAEYQLAERLQAEEQEQFTIEEKATLFKELLEQRRKHFAAKREDEKRNKPPTKTQQKKSKITYLKNMEDLVEGSSKRAGEELEQESTKKQKVDDDKETAELKQCLEIIPDEEEVAIDAITLVVKSPKIVDWKIHKERKKSFYQIVRADGKSKMYRIFSPMLKSFDKEDLEDLYKLVKARYGSTRPLKDLDLVLWNDLKNMFEPHVEDEVWKLQNGYKVLELKLYDSCGVHFLRMQSMQIYMLVEKNYPLTPPTLSMMLEKKLQIDYESEMAYQLFKVNATEGVNAGEVTTASTKLLQLEEVTTASGS